MLDAKSLLDQFLGQQMQEPTTGTLQQRAESDAFGNLPIPESLKGIANAPGALATGALAGGLAGGLAGLLLGGKKPRKMAKSALKVGGVALVGGLAYKAYRDWQADKTAGGASSPAPTPEPTGTPAQIQPAIPQLPPPGTAFNPSDTGEQHGLCTTLIRAMIAAAKADGHISPEERTRIAQQIQAAGMDKDHRDFIEQELAKPLDVDAVAASATSPELAAEIYAASLLAIDADGVAEKGYLAMLAARLNLDPGLVRYLHANADTLSMTASA
jgi:uncharacterized membrane protein YebE (DUF533 family)